MQEVITEANIVRTKLDTANTTKAHAYLIIANKNQTFSAKNQQTNKQTNQISNQNQSHLLASIMLEVTTNLTPAMFSTARLLKNPTQPVIPPIRKQRIHLSRTYRRVRGRLWLRQSCFTKSFSIILAPNKDQKPKEVGITIRTSTKGQVFRTQSRGSQWGRHWSR